MSDRMVEARLCPLLDNQSVSLDYWRKWSKNVYWKSKWFKDLKRQVIERSNGRCVHCPTRKAKTIHHLWLGYLNLWQEDITAYHVEPVCNGCHRILSNKFPRLGKKQKTINSVVIKEDFRKLQEMSRPEQKVSIEISRNSRQDVSILEQSVSNLNKKKEKIDIINVG